MLPASQGSLLRWPLMLLPFALWGTAMAAMKPLLEGGSPLLVASLRLLPAGLLLLLVARLVGRPQAVAAADWPWLLLFALIDGTVFQGLLARGLEQTGADGVMVGRGSLGAPWLVGQIAAALDGRPVPPTPGPAERLALAAEQLQALLASRGERGLQIARKHMGWTCQGFSGAPQLRHALMRAPTPAEALALLAQAAAGLP